MRHQFKRLLIMCNIEDKKRNYFLKVIIIQLLLCGCSINCVSQNLLEQSCRITSDIDLDGRIVNLPEGGVLFFDGGIIKNGTLKGNNTRIVCKKIAFDNVKIQGTWNVPVIYSTWFRDLGYDNAIKDVLALTNPKVKNKVYISEGDYIVKVDAENQACLFIYDNTELYINGTIRLKPNSFKNYYILYVMGNNIKILGKGRIIGDRWKHTGLKGEWGMGIMINKANNVKVSELSVEDCWGDCVYIGGDSKKVAIENCKLIGSRRQGVSITSGKDILLKNLLVSEIGGTAPGYAIDIEPNKNGFVDDIIIEKVHIDNCEGGISVWGKAPNASINKIILNKCNIKNSIKTPISVERCKRINIKKCIVPMMNNVSILCKFVNDVTIVNNKIIAKNDIINKNCIQISNSLNKNIKENIILRNK